MKLVLVGAILMPTTRTKRIVELAIVSCEHFEIRY